MTPQEAKFRQFHIDIVAAFVSAFPGIAPPATSWIQLWLTRYNFLGILAAIQTLQNHPPQLKVRFTQESTGRAISALLRAEALKRAITSAPTPGGRQ
jgi:hypothetical protein